MEVWGGVQALVHPWTEAVAVKWRGLWQTRLKREPGWGWAPMSHAVKGPRELCSQPAPSQTLPADQEPALHLRGC